MNGSRTVRSGLRQPAGRTTVTCWVFHPSRRDLFECTVGLLSKVDAHKLVEYFPESRSNNSGKLSLGLAGGKYCYPVLHLPFLPFVGRFSLHPTRLAGSLLGAHIWMAFFVASVRRLNEDSILG